MIEVKITGIDELKKLAVTQPALYKRAAKSAMSTVGMEFTAIAKQLGRYGSTGGGPMPLGWPILSGYTGALQRAKAPGRYKDKATGQWTYPKNKFMQARQRYKNRARNYYTDDQGSRQHRMWLTASRTGGLRRMPFGRLINALRYKVLAEQGLMRMGFIPEMGAQVEALARKASMGFSTPMTSRMRRFFFALHLPLQAGKSSLVVPPRPYIGRVWNRYEAKMMALFKVKFYANLERYKSGAGMASSFPGGKWGSSAWD
jgi:hypothetical protein